LKTQFFHRELIEPVFPEFFENLKTQLFGRASKSALLQGYPAKHVSLH